nr:ferritin-like domain-containing protein [Methylobacterium sp. ZNC0032]
MNNDAILNSFDPDLAGALASRRDLFLSSAKKLGAAASAPVVLAAVSTQAFGQGMPGQVAEVLNFALTLEYLEDEFYRQGLRAGVVPDRFSPVFRQIAEHEAAHVTLLSSTLGAGAVAKPQFDFTAGGKYGNVFRDFKTFATVAQTFEDTGVAAYAGQAPALMGSNAALTTALRIHSVEARHAAEVRIVRGVRPWKGANDKAMSKAQVLAAVKPFIVG